MNPVNMGQKIYTAIIADDEQLARESIKTLLQRRGNWQVVAEADTASKALKAVKVQNPDLLFLDIEMPGQNGIESLRSAKLTNWPNIVFVTAYNQFAVDAFELNALDYLLKPYSDQKFFKSLDKVEQRLEQNDQIATGEKLSKLLQHYESLFQAQPSPYTERFAVKSVGKIDIVPVDDVCFVQASGSYVELNTSLGKHLMNEPISKFEKQLDPSQFVRIHRSTIVKIKEVAELINHYNGEYIVKMRQGQELKLSRGYKKNLHKLLGSHI